VKKFYLIALLLLLFLPGHVMAACVVSSISVNGSDSGSWDSDCMSSKNPGVYAQYYTFILTSTQEITINLSSSTVDTNLFLLSGGESTGSILKSNNDISSSNKNSRITTILRAGRYTIEASMSGQAQTGHFNVSVSVTTVSAGECEYEIDTGVDVEGNWDPACSSAHRSGRYAIYYTFTLSSTQEVTIDLGSSKNTYMYLLQGSSRNGEELERNDDGGEGENSRIVMTLPAGTYTVEATTYSIATTGSFVISVNTQDPGCDDCLFQINAGLNDAWFNPATGGQGFNISVYPVVKQIFVTWFTYDVERPTSDVTAVLGEPGQRWLTAQGQYEDDTATLTVFVTEGGVFDAAKPAPSTDQDGIGTMTIEFSDCENALVTYDIASLDLSDEIPIERIMMDNVPLCEMLAQP